MSLPPDAARRRLMWSAASFLIALLALQLALSARRQSQTFDEACHIYAGYSYWTRADFGLNPEHPPLVKLLATLPLLPMRLQPPQVPAWALSFFKLEEFVGGRMFVYSGDADAILFRARMAAALLTLLLAALLFTAANEMFGAAAAFLALGLFIFEPTILAHGAVVTTDMAVTLGLFAAVYAFYRYVKRPTWPRLLLTGLAAGLALAAKHSGILVFPTLLLLALSEVIRGGQPSSGTHAAEKSSSSRGRLALRLTGALAAIAIVAVAVLWSFYGFRYAAKPAGQAIVPPLAQFIQGLDHPLGARVILTLARWRVLPEAYLQGLADVVEIADSSRSFLLGHIYSHGQWFYFPAAFFIKSSLGFILLLLTVPVALLSSRIEKWRELLFLALPPAVYLAVAMSSELNIGIRHLLPVFPYLFILCGFAVTRLAARRYQWAYVAAALLLFQVVSSTRAFPNYLAYSNEVAGGPAHTYKLLSDSNADWGQQLKATRQYLDQRGISQCHFAYFADLVADPAYYGIPCKPLPTIISRWFREPRGDIPPAIDGVVLISASVLSSYEFGPGELNPYAAFHNATPVASIQDGILVFEGHFEIPLAAAMNHLAMASRLEDDGRLNQALAESETAVALAPTAVSAQVARANLLRRLGRTEEARATYNRALHLARTIQPEFQKGWLPFLQKASAQ